MTNQPSNEGNRVHFETKIITKAWQDENFKQELLMNPKEVFERESGTKAPEGLQVTILEETPLHYYMVLPVKPNLDESEELSEEALEAVAGGYFISDGTGRWIAGKDYPIVIVLE
ncbi:MAG: NHLP leader peptide family RiPP precursor [Nostoc sp.]|uniref:NHLP leader peptide family RiPP precursor n=1 Tax=Nostoc sp. TaxID=1180 RepID=UPI002FF598F4